MSEFLHKHKNEIGLAVAIAVVIAVAASFSNAYSTPYGRYEVSKIILRDTAMLGIFALGAGAVIIAGGIDLSAGSVIAFSGTLFFGFVIMLAPDDPSTLFPGDPNRHFPSTENLPLWIPLLSLLGVVLVALLIGSFHAWLITVIELPPFVATLASLVGLRSLARLLIQDITALEYGQKQSTITINDEFLTSFSRELWWVPCVVFAALCVLLWLLLQRTVVGRHVYAMGGNETAARLSGVRTDRLKWLVYCIGSTTAAIAGVLYACYIGTTSPATDGLGYELNAIAASVVGGCSLSGGVGTVAGITLGALFLRVVIDSVAKLFKSQPDLFEGLVVGSLVVLAVAVNQLRAAGHQKKFFPGALGGVTIGVLTLLAGVVAYVTVGQDKPRAATLAAGVTFLLVVLRTGFERWRDRDV